MTQFKLPDLGEGLPDAEIVEWHVKEGDFVAVDQKLVSMETAKAVVEVPSPFEGKIVKLFGKAGDIIETGAALVEFESKSPTQSQSQSPTQSDKQTQIQNTEVTQEVTQTEKPATVAGQLETSDTVIEEFSNVNTASRSLAFRNTSQIKATPAIRAAALRLKVELSTIIPSGPNNTITLQDVENAAKLLQDLGPLEPLRGAARAMAQIMSQSHAEVVPVTVMDDAKLIHWGPKEDITVRVIQAIAKAAAVEPALNAWFDGKTLGRRLSREVHLGLAIDTHDGLFVPVLRNIEKSSSESLRQEIESLKKEVEARSITPQAMRGATITLSNFGKFAGRYANPIVVPPMVAIVAIGKIREEVVAFENAPRIAKVLPISLTFDHRAVTGGEATRFLGSLIQQLENK